MLKYLEFRKDRVHYYMNVENGNLVTLSGMLLEAACLYNLSGNVTDCELAEYYVLTNVEIE